LIRSGCDPNESGDPKLLAPLAQAAEAGDLSMVKTLIEHGADVNATAPGVQTPAALLGVCGMVGGSVEVLDHLVKRGIDMRFLDKQLIPLQEAASHGHLEIVDYLLKYGADPARKNDRGWTALHAAAFGGNPDVVRNLLATGMETSVRDNEGRRPIDLAEEQGHEDVIRILEVAPPRT
jgi:ankyrin repeat protein